MYKEKNLIYEAINQILINYTEILINNINKVVGKLVGYTIIDRFNWFNYIEEPCKDSNCTYTIDLPSFKDTINQESEKKMEEDFRKKIILKNWEKQYQKWKKDS